MRQQWLRFFELMFELLRPEPNAPMLAHCPKCRKAMPAIASIEIDLHLTGELHTGLAHCCPYCSTVISVALHPVDAIRSGQAQSSGHQQLNDVDGSEAIGVEHSRR